MKSYIFKAAHQQTKQIIKAGDNYQVTFGAVLKAIYKRVKGITKVVAPIIAQGFTKLTTELRIWDQTKTSNGKGGYCLTLKNKTHEQNITRLLNTATKGTSFYMTQDGKAKSFNGHLAVAIIKNLTK